MAIVAIVATAQNLAIGKNGKLPWHYKADLQFFKRTTTDQAVVMGWNTWASIGKPLPNRLNIILSRAHTIEHQPNVLLMRDQAEVLTLGKYLNCDLCVIGGASIYRLFQNDIERWIVTEIPEIIEDADTFLPADFTRDFAVSDAQTLAGDLRVKTYQRA